MQERRRNRHLFLFGFVEIFQKGKTKPPILLCCDRMHQSEQGCGCGISSSQERSTPHKAETPGGTWHSQETEAGKHLLEI